MSSLPRPRRCAASSSKLQAHEQAGSFLKGPDLAAANTTGRRRSKPPARASAPTSCYSLVTLHDGKPVPKVIDFGVARATEQRLTERKLFTQYGTIVGTLEYMAPEQAELSGHLLLGLITT
jgi:serine/threonine protein kinase